jgi:uncharacterized protein YbjQ (UPF0145 family)
MLVVTTDNLPGYEIREVLGEVIGVTARTHNPFAEGIKSLHGGTNPKMMEALTRWREEAVERMAQEALRRGANAVVGMRFDHREVTTAWVEICAYGTAAVVTLNVAARSAPVPVGATSARGDPIEPSGGPSGGGMPAGGGGPRRPDIR